MFELRERPGHHAEEAARRIVRNRHQSAISAYCNEGVIVYDDLTGEVLGTATAGGWAVEATWQDAVPASIRPDNQSVMLSSIAAAH